MQVAVFFSVGTLLCYSNCRAIVQRGEPPDGLNQLIPASITGLPSGDRGCNPGDPQLVRGARGELPVDQIGSPARQRVGVSCATLTTPLGAADPSGAHQPLALRRAVGSPARAARSTAGVIRRCSRARCTACGWSSSR
jgi:hypothetical protein